MCYNVDVLTRRSAGKCFLTSTYPHNIPHIVRHVRLLSLRVSRCLVRTGLNRRTCR